MNDQKNGNNHSTPIGEGNDSARPSSQEEEIGVPQEINIHLERFGKESWDVNYCLYGYCQVCNTRIDEFGYCACGGAAD